MANNAQKIQALEKILQSGAKSVTVDGLTTTYRSQSEIVSEISRLKKDDTANEYRKKPRAVRIGLGGF